MVDASQLAPTYLKTKKQNLSLNPPAGATRGAGVIHRLVHRHFATCGQACGSHRALRQLLRRFPCSSSSHRLPFWICCRRPVKVIYSSFRGGCWGKLPPAFLLVCQSGYIVQTYPVKLCQGYCVMEWDLLGPSFPSAVLRLCRV